MLLLEGILTLSVTASTVNEFFWQTNFGWRVDWKRKVWRQSTNPNPQLAANLNLRSSEVEREVSSRMCLILKVSKSYFAKVHYNFIKWLELLAVKEKAMIKIFQQQHQWWVPLYSMARILLRNSPLTNLRGVKHLATSAKKKKKRIAYH